MTRRALLVLAGASAARADTIVTDDRAGHIEKLVEAEMAAQRVPGMSIAIVRGGAIWSAAYGLADVENDVRARPETVYRTASIAKPITGVAAARLAETGRLDLDAPARKYVPWLPEPASHVSTRQLLGHIGGVRAYRDAAEDWSTRHFTSLEEAVRSFVDDAFTGEPGARFLYSTLSYVVAGLVMERASGMTYPEILRTLICEPAGMTATRTDDTLAIIANRSRGYSISRHGELQNAGLADTSLKVPGGGLASTAVDLARFLVALDTGKLLSSAAVEEMLRPMRTSDGMSTGYGLGWGKLQASGALEYGHTGGQAGVSTTLRYRPASRTGLAMMFNLQGVAHEALGDRIFALLDE